jgi:hypothetical protein
MNYPIVNGIRFGNISNINGLLNSDGEILTGCNGGLKIIKPELLNSDLMLIYNSNGLTYSNSLNGSKIATQADIDFLLLKIEKMERIIDLLSNSIKSVNI